ncbi:hypothetical protein GCM10023328_46610 [Modestobacter marinus]|uniref:Rv3660c-like CheY-like N-terminal domain-containing protein n=2 Tax=Modestobacter marinus TaxID=477641 RepID=A0ABQ2GAU7_9ACTN|nr:hypothetical protein [Modestobacter marinus]GGL83791.1 hypothetical protein GCM10011589_45180 [Modestobacter marinus]
MDSSQLVDADHLDLLVSAAIAYGQLTSATRAAFSPVHAAAVTAASPDEAGQLLLEENLAAARWRAGRGRGRLPAGRLLTYRHRPVEDWEPVEVLKAVHAYSHATADSPGWAGSAAHRFTVDVAHAAAQHLPGYAEAPWRWRRPSRPGVPVGLCGTWRPDVADISWTTPTELLQRWAHADAVVLTSEVLEQLPAKLPTRSGPVYLLTRPGGLTPHQWELAGLLGQALLVELPTAAAWLQEQLQPDIGVPQRSPRAGMDHTWVRLRPRPS